MQRRFKINRKVINKNYDEKKIQELVAYAQNLNERIIAFEKKEGTRNRCVAVK